MVAAEPRDSQARSERATGVDCDLLAEEGIERCFFDRHDTAPRHGGALGVAMNKGSSRGPILGFDYSAVGEAVETRRQELGLTPSGLIRSVNWLSAAPLARLRDGEPTTCQHVTGLLRWLGRSPESFSPGMVDGPECQIPDFGPYAVRWNMATLWEAMNDQRRKFGASWEDVQQATLCLSVEGVRLETYGIRMHDAMNIVRWLGEPAATFMYPAELSPARPGSAAYGGPSRAEAEASAPSELKNYIVATRGKTDEEIAEFARSHGGFPSICRTIIMWLRAVVDAGEFEIAMDLGDGAAWTFRSSKGTNSFQYQAKKSARSTMRATPADFMRLVFQDLDAEAASASRRIEIHGEIQPVIRVFRSPTP